MRHLAALLLAVLVLVPLAAVPGRADEERHSEPLVTRIWQVGALTHGVTNFIRPASTPAFHDIADEENPLFGCPAEEPVYPYGMVDELIEVLKQGVDPALWEELEGADLMALGEDRILARAPRTHQAKLGAFLVMLEREALTPLTADIRVVRLSEENTRAGAIGFPASDVVAGVSVTALPRQLAVAWNGYQHRYLSDYDVEVAKSATISHPLVNVGNAGLIAQISLHPSAEGGSTRVRLNAILTELASAPLISVGEDREVEKPTWRRFKTHVDGLAKPGAWTLLDTATHVDGTRVGYMVRVTRHELALRPTAPEHAFLDPKPYDDSGKMTTRMIDVGQLNVPAYEIMGRSPWMLMPTHYTPPEPPELAEPSPLFPPEVIPELLMSGLGDEGAWEQGFMEVRNGRLILRNTPPVLDAAEEVVQKLRRASIRTITIDVELIDIDAAAADRLTAAGTFAGAVRERLLENATVERVFAGRLVSARDSRRALTAGDVFTYVGGYAVEIAEDSAISNPVIFRAFEGLELDVKPQLNSTETAVLLESQFVKTSLRSKDRTVDTPHGRIDVPEMNTMRSQGTLFVALGNTVVAGAFGDGPRRRVLLLTPTLQRAAR